MSGSAMADEGLRPTLSKALLLAVIIEYSGWVNVLVMLQQVSTLSTICFHYWDQVLLTSTTKLCSIKGKTSPVVLAVSAWVKQYIYIFSTPSASSSYVVVVSLPILPQNIIMLGIKLYCSILLGHNGLWHIFII